MSYTPPTQVTPQVLVQAQLNWSNTVSPAPAVPVNFPLQLLQAFTSGTGAGAVDTVGFGQFTITASSTQGVFLSTTTPTLTDGYGTKVQFASVKVLILFHLTTTTASSVSWGSTGTNPYLHSLSGTTPLDTVKNGGFRCLGDPSAAGYTVTGASNDRLNILNNDGVNSATVQVIVMGNHA